MQRARWWHAVTAGVVAAALVLQLVLVIIGNPVLADVEPPDLGMRLYRFCAYFTIQSNLLVALASLSLAWRPDRDGPVWRVLRLAGTVAIAVTAVVHFFLLRPLLDLQGLDRLADTLLHLVGPALALAGWLLFGPRPRVTASTVRWALAFPAAWTAWTLVFGAIDGWYPYPFLDPAAQGWAGVTLALVGVSVTFTVGLLAAWWWDRRAAPVGVDPT